MANTYTTNVAIAKPSTGDRGWGGTVNTNSDLLDALAPVGGLAVRVAEVPSATLNVRVAAGRYRKSDGTVVAYAGATAGLFASATNYLYLTDAGALTVNTTGWPAAAHVRLATAVTGASTVTSVTDQRVSVVSAGVSNATVYLPLAGGTFSDGSGVVLVETGTTNGTRFGGGATSKLAFYGAAPAAQPAGAAQAAVGALATQTLTVSTGGVASTTLAVATNTAALTDSTGGTASTTLAAIADAPTANAVASLAAQLATQRALNTVVINSLTTLGTQHGNVRTDLNALLTLVNALRAALVAEGLIKGSV